MNKMSSTNAAAQSTIPFPNLPLELREIIYRHAILPEDLTSQSQPLNFGPVDTRRGGDPLYLQWLEQLCRVNQAARVDVSLYILRTTEFYLIYPEQVVRFTIFLGSLGANDQGFAAIRKLDFQLFGRYQPITGTKNTYIELMKRCTGLREVALKFEVGYMTLDSCNWAEDVVIPPTMLGTFDLWTFDQTRIKELEDVIAIYRMDDLLEIESLQTLTIEAWPRIRVSDRHGMQNVLVDCAPLIERLVVWLREGFATRGRKVDVKYVEASSPGLRWSRKI
ncbi:hypothetical protein J4E93_008895 [Alternaria ventricosa]|uniref:uncharacterized protein n=1 Tax=Alternaria ventricosa TaxID=1187951 RepID=UPI0020C251B7|nr:uncharacterized protein J4E93_008895 [Alternaria ventricosa]KAI4640095.1 hypothetical protein J4E93_008895 [Alternaria ventricosa]